MTGDAALATVIERAGEIDGEEIVRLVLTNKTGLNVSVLSFGATLERVRTAGGVDLVLYHEDVADYRRQPGHLGATVGRFANRIRAGWFDLDGKIHELERNERGRHHLHGGPRGFGQRLWSVVPSLEAGVAEFALTSADGDEGYPGDLEATCTYRLTDKDEIAITMTARTTAATPVNLANHAYWNLAGAGRIDGHVLEVNASQVLEVDEELIPTGSILPVTGGPLDFTMARSLGGGGSAALLDHCFIVDGDGMRPVARLHDPASGRALELSSDQPGVQVYTGDKLVVMDGEQARPRPREGLCLETQAFPDAPNQPGFPSAILRPGETYRHHMLIRLFELHGKDAVLDEPGES